MTGTLAYIQLAVTKENSHASGDQIKRSRKQTSGLYALFLSCFRRLGRAVLVYDYLLSN